MWTDSCEYNFETMKEWLTSMPILSIPKGHDDFVVFSDESGIRLGVC